MPLESLANPDEKTVPRAGRLSSELRNKRAECYEICFNILEYEKLERIDMLVIAPAK